MCSSIGLNVRRKRIGVDVFLRAPLQVNLEVQGYGPVADVSISGLPGWVSISTQQRRGRLALRVWAPAGIEVFVRPPVPVAAPVLR